MTHLRLQAELCKKLVRVTQGVVLGIPSSVTCTLAIQTQWCRDQGDSCWMCVSPATVKQLGLLCVLTFQDEIFVLRYLWRCQQLWAESSVVATATRLELFQSGGCQASWLNVSYCWPKCNDLVGSCEDDLIPVHYKATVHVSSWEPSLFPSNSPFLHLIQYWSEWGSFFAHCRRWLHQIFPGIPGPHTAAT